MIAQIDSGSRAVPSFLSAFCALTTHLQRTPSTPVTYPSPIDPRPISLLDERRYAGQHIHDSAYSSLADERTNNKIQD
jgi:hypothetical protein